MASDRILRVSAAAFAAFAALVVVLGWMPPFITAVHHTPAGAERTMFGLFAMSTLDDITHGLTAVVLAAAALSGSARWCRLAFTAFGWYYALDAVFYLLNGLVNELPWYNDLALNAPHVVISSIMLWLAYGLPAGAGEGKLVGVPVGR